MWTTKRQFFFPFLVLTACVIVNGQQAYAAKDPKILFDKAVSQAESYNLKKAEKSFKKALKSSPDNYSIHFNLALLYFQKNNLKLSLKYGLKASQLNPFDTRIKKLLSSTHFLLEQYEEARTILIALNA